MFKLFSSPLMGDAVFDRLEKTVRDGVTPISVFGVSDGQKIHIAAAIKEEHPLLFVAQGAVAAE